MSMYENSIKCKYCSHFEPGANRCHLYHNYDQSLDKRGGGPYLKETSPDSRCSYFDLPAMDVILKKTINRRADGSYVVELYEDPQLKETLYRAERRKDYSKKKRNYKWLTVSAWVIVGLFVGMLLGGFITRSLVGMVIVMIVCAAIAGYIGAAAD